MRSGKSRHDAGAPKLIILRLIPPLRYLQTLRPLRMQRVRIKEENFSFFVFP
jgi:hypothetical protein